jgi:pilus assembly protein CpaF
VLGGESGVEMSLSMVIEQRVRDVLRATNLDPMRDPQAVRELVQQVVGEVASESVHEPVDVRGLMQDVQDAITGFGPLQRFFDDPQVEEVWINEPGRVFIAREGRSELTSVILTETEVRALVERMLRWSGRRLDVSNPFVDAMLPDGSRLHVVIPDITRAHWSVNIRRFVVRPAHVHDLVATGTLTPQAAHFLDAAVVSGLNVIVAGGTQAGKTTLLNGLLGCVPATERIVSCEEVFEINLQHPDWIAMQTRDASLEGTGAIPLRRLVKEALRMRPTRLVVGEVRQAESLDLLIAMNSGMPAMATIHANSAREAVTKLCTLPLLAGANIAADFVLPTVAGCVDIVVHTATRRDGQRRVQEIVALPGRVESGVLEIADLFVDRGDGLQRAQGFPPHAERFRRAGFDVAAILTDHVRAA